MKDKIAIVGIGCRYPEAENVAALWKLLLDSRSAISTYPGSRFAELDAFYGSSNDRPPGQIDIARGGFLKDVDQFDSQFFEIAPREAVYLDPQYRLLLEVAWEALEDAGQVREQYFGSQSGVYIGLWTSEYEEYLYRSSTETNFYMMTGGGRATAAGRLSFNFGLKGPSVSIDTACSSSLVAVHMACEALQSGEINMALAGGVNLIFDKARTELFIQANMLSADGTCKFGDAAADGFVRSEGAGIVVLKRLSDAITAGDPIYAVIRGSAVNNDGHSNGLMATPSLEGQQDMLRQAWKRADIDPSRIRYIEAHGTGTSVGDPVEINAIGNALLEAGVDRPCLLGSIKTNIGHCETASGVAGLIKAALSLKNKTLPPTLHFRKPNPNIAWDRLPVQVLTEAVDLSGDRDPVIVGVNSFGLSGTNAHVVLEDFRPAVDFPAAPGGAHLFLASAHTSEALDIVLHGVAEARDRDSTFYELCHTAALRRTHLDYRAAVVASNTDELRAKLTSLLAAEAVEGTSRGRRFPGTRRVVFVCPGQGSQWAGMGRELYSSEPVFRTELERCSVAIQNETGWSLTERLFDTAIEKSLEEIDFIQPSLFAVTVSLAALWKSWGIVPSAVVGHSMGEVAAAFIAGALSLEDAIAVICRRSRLMMTIRGRGAMATIELAAADVEKRLQEYHGQIVVAASNSPNTTVIAGNPEQIDRLLTDLDRDEIFCRRVKVDVASHCFHVDPILEELSVQLASVHASPVTCPLYSTVIGKSVAGPEMSTEYWVRNLREPVLFAQAIKHLAKDSCDIFIELSPHPVLLPAIEETLRIAGTDAVSVPSLRRQKPERATILSSLGAVFTAGYPVNWKKVLPVAARAASFPSYPFRRERCWPDLATLSSDRLARKSTDFPFLRQRFTSSLQPDTTVWDVDLNLSRFKYLNDHKVRDCIIVPATVQIEIALEAIHSLGINGAHELHEMTLETPLQPADDVSQEIQVSLTRRTETSFEFQIRARARSMSGEWELHSKGVLRRGRERINKPATISIADLTASGTHHTSAEHYKALSRTGISYGPAFQLVAESWTTEKQNLIRIDTHPAERWDRRYILYPPVLDACLQSISNIGTQRSRATFLPVGVKGLVLHQTFAGKNDIYCLARELRSDEKKGIVDISLRICDSEGSLLAEIDELKVQRTRSGNTKNTADLLFGYDWLKSPLAIPAPPLLIDQHVLIFADRSGVADSLCDLILRNGGRASLVYPAPEYSQNAGTFFINPRERHDIERILAANQADPFGTIVHLWSVDRPSGEKFEGEDLLAAQDCRAFHLPIVVQALTRANLSKTPRLWTVTKGVVSVDRDSATPDVFAAPLWGAGTAIAQEHPELSPCLVDLPPDASFADFVDLAGIILAETEVERSTALRHHAMYVPRLSRFQTASTMSKPRALGDDEEYQVVTRDPGILDHIQTRPVPRRQPGPGEVAIEISAAGMNFIDVAKAMGIYPGLDPNAQIALGGECCGRVVAIGSRVSGFAIGAEVVAVTPDPTTCGLLASYQVVPQELVAAKPPHLSREQAAAFPIAYITAYHSLRRLAHATAGEWILIPSAAGGVGLAAIEIAQKIGARVIATASSAEKHAYLKSIGVEHILQSRTADFADQAMAITGGRGVDIVLNSLAGDYITRSIEILAPFGRFIELGKRDIYQDRHVGLKAFRNNISYHVVDIAAMIVDRRSELAGLFQEVVSKLASRDWKPLPVKTFSSAQSSDAFRYMAQSRHIGKVVLEMGKDASVTDHDDRVVLRPHATYLVTGGLGGVGFAVARWMALNGARHLVLVSRRESSSETESQISELESLGAEVIHTQVDTSQSKDVEALVARIRDTMPTLRGIFHAAASIDDCLAIDCTRDRFITAMSGKAMGAWNLHCATSDLPLDFFVMCSSMAALYPQVGVTSYAAANVFLDALARYRKSKGLCATSVNWGAWNQTGLARERGTKRTIDSYEQQGLESFGQQEGLDCLTAAILQQPVQLAVFGFNAEEFLQFHEELGTPPLFRDLARKVETRSAIEGPLSLIRDELQQARSFSVRKDLMGRYLQEQLGTVLKLPSERIDRDRPFGTMGLDSLMALEFTRRVNAGLGTTLPATAAFNYPSVRQFSALLLGKLGFAEESTAEEGIRPSDIGASFSSTALNELSEGEALRELIETNGVAHER